MNAMTYKGYTARIEYDDSNKIFLPPQQNLWADSGSGKAPSA